MSLQVVETWLQPFYNVLQCTMLHVTKCIEINAPTSQHILTRLLEFPSVPVVTRIALARRNLQSDSPTGVQGLRFHRFLGPTVQLWGECVSTPTASATHWNPVPQLHRDLHHQGGRGWHSQERWCSSGAQVAGKVQMRGNVAAVEAWVFGWFSGQFRMIEYDRMI